MHLLFIVIIFVVILSMFWSSFFAHLITPPPYRNTATAHVFTALILFPPLNLEFITNFKIRRYSYLRISFISFSFTLSVPSISCACTTLHPLPYLSHHSHVECPQSYSASHYSLLSPCPSLKQLPFLYLVRGVGRWIPNY